MLQILNDFLLPHFFENPLEINIVVVSILEKIQS
jgi:hypothetical protein